MGEDSAPPAPKVVVYIPVDGAPRLQTVVIPHAGKLLGDCHGLTDYRTLHGLPGYDLDLLMKDTYDPDEVPNDVANTLISYLRFKGRHVKCNNICGPTLLFEGERDMTAELWRAIQEQVRSMRKATAK